jgi:hypothetical protein
MRCSSRLGAAPSSARRLRLASPRHIADELTSVLPFHGQHAFALGTVIALAECSRAPSQVLACPA